MALVCGYGPINPQPWMTPEPPMPQPSGSVMSMDGKIVMNPGVLGDVRGFVPELGQFVSDQCRNPGCKCQALKTKSSYGYVRHVRRSHGLPTTVSRRMCEYGNIHVDSRFTKPLSVDTGTEYELPKHLYPPARSDPILMIHPSYKRYLGIKQRFMAPNVGSANLQWNDQIKRCGSAQRQNDVNASMASYVTKSQMHPQNMVSHVRQSSLPVDVTKPTYTHIESGHYRSNSTDQAFMPTCADLGIPVSQPQFKIPTVPMTAKRPKQDFVVTSQMQAFTPSSYPPPYYKENHAPPPPYYASASSSSSNSSVSTPSSLDRLNARDMFYQQARVEATPASMKLPPGVTFSQESLFGQNLGLSTVVTGASTSTSGSGMQMSMTYVNDQLRQFPSFQQPQGTIQQQLNLPPPPPYYSGIKFALPAPQMVSIGSNIGSMPTSASTSTYPVFANSGLPTVSRASYSAQLYSIHQQHLHQHMTAASAVSNSTTMSAPRIVNTSSFGTPMMQQSTEMMMASIPEFPSSADDSAMRNARRLPKSGKARAMRFHSFCGDRES